MKLNEIKEIGFYYQTDFPDRYYIYEVFENTDEEWLQESPEDKFLIDEWIFDYEDMDDIKHYGCGGNLVAVRKACNIEVTKITDMKYIVNDLYMQENKPTYKEKYNNLTQTLKDIKEIAERIINNYDGNQSENMQEEAKQILQKVKEVIDER